MTLKNESRNALELTIRAGSPERWAVAPATVFLEAGRTMRVDLRLKLAREMRPKRPAGGSGAVKGDDAGSGGLRQRDVFHVKTEYFEQRFHASFVMATPEEITAVEAREAENTRDPAGHGERTIRNGASGSDRGRSSGTGATRSPQTLPDRVTERSRSASPGWRGRELEGGSPGRYSGGSKVWDRAESAPPARWRADPEDEVDDSSFGGSRGVSKVGGQSKHKSGGAEVTPLRSRPGGSSGGACDDEYRNHGEGARARSPLSRSPASRSGGDRQGSRRSGPAVGWDLDNVEPALRPGETRINKNEVETLRKRLKVLEESNSQKDMESRDKEELIRALYSRLELAKTNKDVDCGNASDENVDPSSQGCVRGSGDRVGMAEALQTARARQAELHGANTALRGRCQELDGEVQALRTEVASLRHRLETLQGEKLPEMTELVSQALAQERASFEAQSLKALRVLEAKDSVLQAREREVAEARAEAGSLSMTLAATRRELDTCEARLIAVLDEQGNLRGDLEQTRTDASRVEAQLRRDVTRLTAELEHANNRGVGAEAAAQKAARLEEECTFLRAEASAASEAVAAAKEEAAELKAALRRASELRAAEREQLAQHVARAEEERRAIASTAAEDGARLTAELAQAHQSLAAALDTAAFDRILTGPPVAVEAAKAAEGAQGSKLAAHQAMRTTPGRPPLPPTTTTQGTQHAPAARGHHVQTSTSVSTVSAGTSTSVATSTAGTTIQPPRMAAAGIVTSHPSTAVATTTTSPPDTATAETSTSQPGTASAQTLTSVPSMMKGTHTQTPDVAVAPTLNFTTATASPIHVAHAASTSDATASTALAAGTAETGSQAATAAYVDVVDPSQTSAPQVMRFEPTTPATNTTAAAVVSSGPEKVAREIVRLQRERDEAVAAAARASQAAAEAQRVADDSKEIIAAAAARAAASDCTFSGAHAAAFPGAPGGSVHAHSHQGTVQPHGASDGFASGSGSVDAGRHAAEIASLELQVKELQSALRLRDGEARRTHVQMSADHAAETEALRTELAALRDRLRYAASNSSKVPNLSGQRREQRRRPGGSREGDGSDGAYSDSATYRVTDAENRARTAEAEIDAMRERLAELEALQRTAQETAVRGERQLVAAKKDLAAAAKKTGDGGISVEARLSARVSELAQAERAAREDAVAARAELTAATNHISELEKTMRSAGVAAPSQNKRRMMAAATTAARGLEDARSDALDSEAASTALRSRLEGAEQRCTQAEGRLAAAEVRWGNERARLESKIRAARDDGSVRIQSLEATVASLRTRSGLHSEVARLGEEASQLRRAEARLRHELAFAEERLGHALLELQQLRVDGERDASAASATGDKADVSSRCLQLTSSADTVGGSSGGDPGAREGALERAQDRLIALEKDAVLYRAEVDQLREEVERAALERGREVTARADVSRELAAALERVAERDRALHDAREAAALAKERAAAARAHEITVATRRSAAAEARASQAGAAAATAREEAREARTECARRIAAADAQRSRAENAAAAAQEAEAGAVAEAAASRREAERAAAVLEERGVQLQILTETIEALQAAAGSGDREQRVVTLAAQAATARASEAALERRCLELAQESQAHLSRCARLESQVAAAHRSVAAAEGRSREARAREELARQESTAARSETAARDEALAAAARRCDDAVEARLAAESREASARKALEAQHARHLEQLSVEREAAADRLHAAEANAARAVAVAARDAEGVGAAAVMHPDDLTAAVREANDVRKRIEQSLNDLAAACTARLVGSGRGGDADAAEDEDPRKGPATTVLRGDADWNAAVIQRLRQLVLEAEREVGRAMAAARSATAGEMAATRRAAMAEAALDARTAAWEEASAAVAAAEERLARRATVTASCADQRLHLAQERIAQLSESLSSAGRRLIAAETAAASAGAAARSEANRADALGRRVRVAEADAAAAKQSAAAAAEELQGSCGKDDVERHLKAYFESVQIRELITGDGMGADGKLLSVTRELCAAKLTERSLLASLAAARRRADAAVAHEAEIQASLEAAETRVAVAEGISHDADAIKNDMRGDFSTRAGHSGVENDSSEVLAAQLAARAHEVYAAREEVLRLRQRVSELELEVADLAGSREAAAAAASAAREDARAEIAAAATRATENFRAKAASLKNELEAERSVLQAAVREAQAQAQAARAEAAAAVAAASERTDYAQREAREAEARGAGVARAEVEEDVIALQAAAAKAEAKAEKAEERARAAQSAAAALKDEVELKTGVIEQLRRAFAALDSGAEGMSEGKGVGRKPAAVSALSGKRSTRARSASPTSRVRASGGGASSPEGTGSATTAGALGRRLVDAKLAEADAQRKLKVAARAEMELQHIVAKRDARIVELKRQLTDKTKALQAAKWAVRPPTVSAAGHAVAAAAVAEQEAREALMRATHAREDDADASWGGSSGDDSQSGGSPILCSPLRDVSQGPLELENARLRAEKSRAEAEIEKLRAEFNAAIAHAPTPEEIEVLQDEVLELRQRVAGATSASTSAAEFGAVGAGAAMSENDMRTVVARELQADVNAAVTAAAAALTGAPPPPPPGSRDAPPRPPPGSAAAAVEQLSYALRDAQSATNKAKHELAEARRSMRESGKEKAAVAGVEASQRSVIRELTQRAAALGRDKAELVDERDKLRERLRALRASMGGRAGSFDAVDRRPTPNHGNMPISTPMTTPRGSVSVSVAQQHAVAFQPQQRPPLVLHSDASTQAGAARGAGVLVDAKALTQLLSQQVAGLEPAATFVTEQAAVQANAEMARVANSLSVETAAMRAVLSALSAEDASELSPTELVTKAATAAMAAMPSAPLVHTILPSVVAPAVAMAPLAADANTINAPVARAACVDRSTDTEGLVMGVVYAEVGTDAAPITAEMCTGPDGAADPVLMSAPRDAATSPGAMHATFRDASTGVGTSTSPPPGRQILRDTGSDPEPLTFEAQVGTDLDGSAVEAGTVAVEEREELRQRLADEEEASAAARKVAAAETENAKKWKDRSEALRVDLAAAIEKAADAERRLAEETSELRVRLRAEENAKLALERAPQLRIEQTTDIPPALQSTLMGESLVAARGALPRVGDVAFTAAAEAARAEATAAAEEVQRLQDELRTRDAEHAQMITALRSTIRGMRNSTPADRAAYLEALRIHSDSAERNKREREEAAAAKSASAGVGPLIEARMSSEDQREHARRASALADRLTRAEQRMEQALATTAAALDAAEHGAATAGEQAAFQYRAVASQMEEANKAAELIARRTAALELAMEKGAAAAGAARWAHVARCNRYRDLLRRLLDEHKYDRRKAAVALAAAETETMEARRQAVEARAEAQAERERANAAKAAVKRAEASREAVARAGPEGAPSQAAKAYFPLSPSTEDFAAYKLRKEDQITRLELEIARLTSEVSVLAEKATGKRRRRGDGAGGKAASAEVEAESFSGSDSSASSEGKGHPATAPADVFAPAATTSGSGPVQVARPPFSLPVVGDEGDGTFGGNREYDDLEANASTAVAAVETSTQRNSSATAAATELLAKLRSSRSDAERLDTLERRLRAADAELFAARKRGKENAQQRDHAETRAKLASEALQKFKSASASDIATLKQRVATAENRLAEHGPEAWDALKSQLAEANKNLKRARADVKRLQSNPGVSRAANEEMKHERERATKLEAMLVDAHSKAKEARGALTRKETYVTELKRKLEVAHEDIRRLSQETKLGEAEAKVKQMQMAHARKDAVIESLRGKLEEACTAAASEAVNEEHERAMELSKRLRREIARKDEMLKAHDGRLEALRTELDAGREAVAMAESSRERAWALAGSEAAALRKRSTALLSGVRSLAHRLLRLSAAVGHTVGAAARTKAGPVEAGIAELVDMEPEEVADLLGADETAAVASQEEAPPRGGRAASPASYAAIISAMDAKAGELELALCFLDDAGKQASASFTSSTGNKSEKPSSSSAPIDGDADKPSSTDRWRDEALQFILDAAEAEAEHAEAALRAAVPAMHEWWLQVMAAGNSAPTTDGRKGTHARHTEGRASARRRAEAARKGDLAGVRNAWPMGKDGELGSQGMRARLAGAAALLDSDTSISEEDCT